MLFQDHQLPVSEEGDFWRFLAYMDLEAILVITFEQIFIQASHGGSIWNLASNGLATFRKRSLKMLNLSDLGQRSMNDFVNEWPWPVINRHVLIYLTIYTNFHLMGFKTFLEIYSLIIIQYKIKRDEIWPCCKIGQGQPRVIIWILE